MSRPPEGLAQYVVSLNAVEIGPFITDKDKAGMTAAEFEVERCGWTLQ
jgi:hypothetical protein